MRPVIKRLELSTTANALIRTNSNREQEYFNGATQNHVLALDASLVPNFVDINTLVVGDATEIPYFDGSGNFVHTSDFTRTGVGEIAIGDGTGVSILSLNSSVSNNNRIRYQFGGTDYWYSGMNTSSPTYYIAANTGAGSSGHYLAMNYASGVLIHSKYTTDNNLGAAVNILGNDSSGQIVQVNNLADLVTISGGYNISSISSKLANGYTNATTARDNAYNGGIIHQAYGNNTTVSGNGLRQSLYRSDNTSDVYYELQNSSADTTQYRKVSDTALTNFNLSKSTQNYYYDSVGGGTSTDGIYEIYTTDQTANKVFYRRVNNIDSTEYSRIIQNYNEFTFTFVNAGDTLDEFTPLAISSHTNDDLIVTFNSGRGAAFVNSGLDVRYNSKGAGATSVRWYHDGTYVGRSLYENATNLYYIWQSAIGGGLFTMNNVTGSLINGSYGTGENTGDITAVLGLSATGQFLRNELISTGTDYIVLGGKIGINDEGIPPYTLSTLENLTSNGIGTNHILVSHRASAPDNNGSVSWRLIAGTSNSSAANFEIQQVTSGGNSPLGTFFDTNLVNNNASTEGTWGNINLVTLGASRLTIKGGDSAGTVQLNSYTTGNQTGNITAVAGLDSNGNILRNEVLSVSGNTVTLDAGSGNQALVFNSTNANGSYIEVQSSGTTQGVFGYGTALFGASFNNYAGVRGQNGVMLSIGTSGGLSINSSSQVTFDRYTTGNNEGAAESLLGVDGGGQIYRVNNAKNLVSYTKGFTTGDWIGSGLYTYTIAATSHGLGTGFFHVSLFDSSGNQVGVQNIQIVSGDVTVTSITQFNGTIYIS